MCNYNMQSNVESKLLLFGQQIIYFLFNKLNQVGHCYPLKMLQLLCILLFLFHSISTVTFYNPHFRYKTANLEFYDGLHTRDHASQFISSEGRLIAKSKVAIANTSTPRMPVLTSPANTYGLFDLLQFVYDHRGNHVVIFTFENRESLRMAHWTLSYFSKNWIWIHVAILQGPNGDPPTFTGDELQAELSQLGMIKRVWMCYDMTTKPIEPYGYTKKHLEDLDKFTFTGVLEKTPSLMMFDIVHASHSAIDIEVKIMKIMMYIIFVEKNQTNVEDINMRGLWKLIDGLGIARVYLDVNPELRKNIMLRYPDPEDDKDVPKINGAVRKMKEGLLLWTTLIVIYLLY